MRQEQASLPYPGILISVGHVVVTRLFPGIARFCMPFFAELACRVYSLTELANDLLGTLGAESRIASFAPPLPTGFAGPLEGTTAYPLMTRDEITPQTRSFLARRTKYAPFRGCSWHPMYFYCTITHAISLGRAYRKVQNNLLPADGQRVLHLHPNALRSGWSTARDIW